MQTLQKNHLMQLKNKIAGEFDLKPRRVTPAGKIYLIQTYDEVFVLKEVCFSPAEIIFLHAVQKKVHAKSELNVVLYEETLKGLPYLCHNQRKFIVKKFIRGVHPAFGDQNAWHLAVKAMARLHACTAGFIPEIVPPSRLYLSNWPAIWSRKISELCDFYRRQQKLNRKTPFIRLFLETFQSVKTTMEKNMPLLEGITAFSVIPGAFCHHDLSERNMLIGANDRFFLLDWENGLFDFPMHDLLHLTVYHLFAAPPEKWRSLARKITGLYHEVNPLSDKERRLLYILSLWPQKYWRIVQQYMKKEPLRTEVEYFNTLKKIIGFYRQMDLLKPFQWD